MLPSCSFNWRFSIDFTCNRFYVMSFCYNNIFVALCSDPVISQNEEKQAFSSCCNNTDISITFFFSVLLGNVVTVIE